LTKRPVLGADVQFLFENHTLDVERRELRRGAELVAVEPQVFDLLVYLVRNRDRVVTKDDLMAAVWGGRIVSESTLTSRINAVRKAVGDSGEHQNLIRTAARKGIRFVAAVSETARGVSGGSADVAQSFSKPPHLRQEVHFCTAPDGVRIAYAEVGKGPPLVRTGHWLTHLEYDWESPVWSPFLDALAAQYRLVRYDARGNGLSDWDVGEISFDAFVRDLETVIEATGLDRFPLLGMSQGAAMSIAYAVRHPERVSHLVLYGGFARGRRMRGSQQEVANADAVMTLMRHGWGQENPAFRQLFTSLFIPGGTPEQVEWYNDLQRMTTSPDNAVRLRSAVDDIDVTGLLPQVRAPTLVLHCRNDAVQPFEEGRRIAAGIPGARFVTLEGRNHILLEGDPAWPRFLDEVKTFLAT
jgi:pimeloyl-ACP methyl ester carboxylesterase/DNA-binding winged helix-turn-helix (wHTH) protein